jgi:ferredoxin
MAAVTTPAPQAPAGQAGPDAAAAAGGMVAVQGSPFDLADDDTYRRWRRWKLAHRLVDTAPLWVELADARKLTPDEAAALRLRIGRHGMALYRSPDLQADPGLPRALGAQLGLHRLDANWLADEDGISPIAVAREGHPARGDFIPYTDRAIRWHTDGYYHPQARRIRGMILHCVRPAAEGGETSLLDPELLYIALRDESPALVRALQHPQAMTIPARDDESGVARPAQSGPVFETVQGRLHCATRRAHAASSGATTRSPARPWSAWRHCWPTTGWVCCAPHCRPAAGWWGTTCCTTAALPGRPGRAPAALPRPLPRPHRFGRGGRLVARRESCMAQWVTVWRAAQLVGVPRGVLQQRVREGDLELADGLVSPKHCWRCTRRPGSRKAACSSAWCRSATKPSAAGCASACCPARRCWRSACSSQSQELADAQRHLQRYHALVLALRDRLRQLDAESGGSDPRLPTPCARLNDGLARALATEPVDMLDVMDDMLKVVSAQVTVRPSGHQFMVEGHDSLLQAGMKAGLKLNYGCGNGSCGMCKVRVTDGQVARCMHSDYALSEPEKAQGYVLSCAHTAASSELTMETLEAGGPADIPLQQIVTTVRAMQAPGRRHAAAAPADTAHAPPALPGRPVGHTGPGRR